MNLSVIDADSIVFICGMRWQDASHSQMMGQVSQFVESILSQTNATHYLGFLGGEGNFRKEVAVTKTYKGNRGPKPESITYWEEPIKSFLVDHWGFVRCHGIEADDACSIAHTKYSQDYSLTICGCDHDLLQLSGKHYNYSKGTHQTLIPEEAEFNLHYQLLVGCTGDTVPGLPKCGDVRARKLLGESTPDHYWTTVESAYCDKLGMDLYPDYLMEQYTLLKLLEDGDKYGFTLPQPLPVPQAQEPVLESIDHLFV